MIDFVSLCLYWIATVGITTGAVFMFGFLPPLFLIALSIKWPRTAINIGIFIFTYFFLSFFGMITADYIAENRSSLSIARKNWMSQHNESYPNALKKFPHGEYLLTSQPVDPARWQIMYNGLTIPIKGYHHNNWDFEPYDVMDVYRKVDRKTVR